MRIQEILDMPTVLNNTHESSYRVYHALERVKSLLEHGVPNDVILELIEEMDSKYGTTDKN